MSEPNFEERRKSPRIEKYFIVTYYDINFPDQTYCTTQLKNISCGGMLLITEMPFETGTMLGIEIKSPFFANITHLRGEVLESFESAKEIFYHTRVQFVDLSPEAQIVIEQSIDFFKNKENINE